MLPILLVPGLCCTAEVFAPQLPALWPQGPLTIANTLVGETMGAIAGHILSTAPPRFALAGISMGGYLALEIMRQQPHRVEKLALIDTSARPDRPEQTAMRRAAVDRARRGEFAGVLQDAFPASVSPDHVGDLALQALSLRMGQAVGVDGFARQQEAIIGRTDSRPHLAAIAVPTTVIVGEADQMMPVAISQEMAEGIPGARLIVIKDAGHMSPHENPEAVTAALLGWIGD